MREFPGRSVLLVVLVIRLGAMLLAVSASLTAVHRLRRRVVVLFFAVTALWWRLGCCLGSGSAGHLARVAWSSGCLVRAFCVVSNLLWSSGILFGALSGWLRCRFATYCCTHLGRTNSWCCLLLFVLFHKLRLPAVLARVCAAVFVGIAHAVPVGGFCFRIPR